MRWGEDKGQGGRGIKDDVRVFGITHPALFMRSLSCLRRWQLGTVAPELHLQSQADFPTSAHVSGCSLELPSPRLESGQLDEVPSGPRLLETAQHLTQG